MKKMKIKGAFTTSITKKIGDRVYVDVPIIEERGSSGIAYIRASLFKKVNKKKIHYINLVIKNRKTAVYRRVYLSPFEAKVITFFIKIQRRTPPGKYNVVAVAREKPNLRSKIICKKTDRNVLNIETKSLLFGL